MSQEHLKDEQLEALFRSAPNGGERLALDRGVSAEVTTHLDNCEHCREMVGAHRELMDQFALLQTSDAGLRGPQCPPDNVWFEIAAGMEVESTEDLLGHAGPCHHCGPLLRQAVEDCATEMTQQEEARITGLRSANIKWQHELVSRVCREKAVPAAKTQDKKPWWSRLRQDFTPLRLALGASLAGLVVIGVADYRLATNLSTERTEAKVEINRLQADLSAQKRNSAETTTLLKGSLLPLQTHHSLPPAELQHSANASPIAYLALNSGMTRGPGQMSRIAIPAGTEIVRIAVQLPDIQPGKLQEQLVTPDGSRIWSQTLEPSALELRTKVLSIFLPSYLLKPNDYQIIISRESADGSDRLGSYPFRVIHPRASPTDATVDSRVEPQ